MQNNRLKHANHLPLKLKGYIEGFYGHLLNWDDRFRLLQKLASCEMNAYLYAPKDDPCHRFDWRVDYDADWCAGFAQFCDTASMRNISVIAGIAPGLDFNFADLCNAGNSQNNDFMILCAKANQLRANGANHIALLMDDIAADFAQRAGDYESEGTAHAALANRLADDLECPILLVPRIYADELVTDIDVQSASYLDDLTASLDPASAIIHCGSHIVAPHIGSKDFAARSPSRQHRMIIWDNIYAQDYCPRRLFTGPYRERDGDGDILLNPTGMIETDLLLLDIMARKQSWPDIIKAASIPDVFITLAAYFDAPYGFDPVFDMPEDNDALAALETLLWSWKSPLQREWYPFLMGLKHDILMRRGELPALRVTKTQTPALAAHILASMNDVKTDHET
ncbi:beta-N-acetylglucosaminidase domain-containing protein [Candidatus Puniceispirillum sp.]|uniref:beta-N-acetylglucosaminidase domain-containing protein n=1 Tax=Candidatus Puniceispirillum sp. TaxID=2026719 RepID=UPI003F6A3A76